MTRRWVGAAGGAALMVAAVGGAEAGVGGPRAVRAVQDLPELGLTVEVAADPDGSLVLTGTAGDLSVRKRVYADGSYAVRIGRGDDQVVISASAAGTKIEAGGQRAELQARDDLRFEAEARRARGWLARSGAIRQFRQLVDALDEQGLTSPEAMALRITGAVVSELLGDPGAARRLSRSVTARQDRALRKVQSGGSGYKMSCWDIYHRLVVQAASQLEGCLNSFSTFNPTRNLCVFVWTMQVESAWFQFLACSSIPVR
jgi:hypothetical protein